MNIQLLHNDEIDLFQWDYTVNTSVNSSVFGFSWFLEALDKDWYGLTTEGYQHIMPVLFSHSYKCSFIDTVGVLPLHAIYSRQMLCKDVNTHFLLFLKDKVPYLHISLDKMTAVYDYLHLKTYTLPSFELDLITSYKWKQQRYSANLIKNLHVMKQRGYSVRKEQDSSLAKNKFAKRYSGTHKTTIQLSGKQFKRLIGKLDHYHLCSYYGAYSSSGSCIALAMFVKTQHHYLLLATWQNKRNAKLPLLALIIDQFLQVNSEKALTLYLDNLMGSAYSTELTGLGAKRSHQTLVKQGTKHWFQRIKIS
ncbi:MAG: hypothetical protein R6U66_05030 [Bacteroidales bacterium]|jgi:hypothetical protein